MKMKKVGLALLVAALAVSSVTACGKKKKEEPKKVEKLAYIFHQKLADLITDGCRKIRKKTKCNCVALSGGVFQNRLLLRMVEEGLDKEHFTVLRHHLIPANDGGIALGQAAYAMQYIQEGK